MIRYLRANRDALTDYRLQDGFRDPNQRGLGAAEGNVDKVMANRVSKRGMAWSVEGARRTAKVLEASHNASSMRRFLGVPPQPAGELLSRNSSTRTRPTPLSAATRRASGGHPLSTTAQNEFGPLLR